MKNIKDCSIGAQIVDGKFLPMLTVFFADGETVNYVADVEFAVDDASAIGAVWQGVADDLKEKYGTIEGEHWHRAGIAIIEHFRMMPDEASRHGNS